MAQAIWKGVIAFKGVKVPVKLYSAVTAKDIHFNLLHDKDLQRVTQKMINPNSGEEVPYQEIQKGLEVEPGNFVIVNDADLESIIPSESRDITIERFVPANQINHQWFERPYYLGPDTQAEQYWALAQAMSQQGTQGIARWVMRKKEYVGALRLEKGYLMLIALRFASEVIPASELEAPGGRKPDAREITMAEQLVSALAEDAFDASAFKDEHRERVLEFVARKAKGEKIRLHKPVERKAAQNSLESILKASLTAVKGRRSA